MDTRRRTLLNGLLATAGGLLARGAAGAPPADMKGVQALQADWRELLASGVEVPSPGDTLDLSEEAWRQRLDPRQYHILRDEGTEPAGTSPLNSEKRAGVYACAGCGLPLFTSAMKYESHTGWPSFFTTIAGVFGTKTDFKAILPRTEYHCIRCGGHHGHVFGDGPPPTGQRWCNNGLALRFIPSSRES